MTTTTHRRAKATPAPAEDDRPLKVLYGFALVCRHCGHRFARGASTRDLSAHYKYLHVGSVQVLLAPICQHCDGRVTYSHTSDGGRQHHYGCPTCHRARIVRSAT